MLPEGDQGNIGFSVEHGELDPHPEFSGEGLSDSGRNGSARHSSLRQALQAKLRIVTSTSESLDSKSMDFVTVGLGFLFLTLSGRGARAGGRFGLSGGKGTAHSAVQEDLAGRARPVHHNVKDCVRVFFTLLRTTLEVGDYAFVVGLGAGLVEGTEGHDGSRPVGPHVATPDLAVEEVQEI